MAQHDRQLADFPIEGEAPARHQGLQQEYEELLKLDEQIASILEDRRRLTERIQIISKQLREQCEHAFDRANQPPPIEPEMPKGLGG